ncbi:MAG: phosphomevalonate kinase [Alkalibacterium sp.]|nr:phosphomevalonate kinase [Alkalibacterium sp.]
MKKTQAKAPGKLYIAGEYAVVEPGYPAIIVAVDRFITVDVSPAEENSGSIYSTVLSSDNIKWKRHHNQILFTPSVPKAEIIQAAMTAAEEYIRSIIPDIPYYDVTITSDMVNDQGVKYGLGSSGAVTVALIQALLKAFSVQYTSLLLYKLAAVAHLSLNSSGSFGDLAAASFTGMIAYASFNKQSVRDQLETRSIKDIVETEWEDLFIEQLPPLKDLSLLVGWTGSPASTESLVSHVAHSRETLSYDQFLSESKGCVNRLITAIKQQDTSAILTEVAINRQLLLKMSHSKQFELETPLLSKLCSISEAHHATAKTSGAGGGDCGIALIPRDADRDAIVNEWSKAGITSLPLTVYTH